jgi:ribonuclease G
MEADREEVLERALPFREGEEVYLEIIEPHMYSAGDAVAKVDGYIISVKEAEGAVGQKRLVQIREVGRTQAVAVLIDQPPVVEAQNRTPPKLQLTGADASGTAAAKSTAPRSSTRRSRAVKPAIVQEISTADEPVHEQGEPVHGQGEPVPEPGNDLPATRARKPRGAARSSAATAPAPADNAGADAPEVAGAEAGGESAAAPSRRSSRPRRAAKPKPETGAEATEAAGSGVPSGTANGDPPSVESDSAANVHDSGTGDDTAGNGTDGVESPPRRRGRRGGRRRSAAKAGATATAEESSSE